MSTTPEDVRFLTWDYREQPDLDDLAAAVWEISNGRVHIANVETRSDQYAIVVSAEKLPLAEVDRLWQEAAEI